MNEEWYRDLTYEDKAKELSILCTCGWESKQGYLAKFLEKNLSEEGSFLPKSRFHEANCKRCGKSTRFCFAINIHSKYSTLKSRYCNKCKYRFKCFSSVLI